MEQLQRALLVAPDPVRPPTFGNLGIVEPRTVGLEDDLAAGVALLDAGQDELAPGEAVSLRVADLRIRGPLFGQIFAVVLGRKPSLAIARKTRVNPKYIAMIAVVKPAMAPKATICAEYLWPYCNNA